MSKTRSRDRGFIKNVSEESLLRPLRYTSPVFYVWIFVLLVAVGWFLFAWYTQLSQGLAITGMRSIPGGAPWGFYITNFVFFIGITHAGIAIASAIRLLEIKEYMPIARIAELITIISLIVAGFSIVLDVGRPDNLINLILYYPQRIWHSPLIWDLTAVATYLVFAMTYLYIEMREDLKRLMNETRFKWLYKLLLPLYEKGERKRFERIIWWASLFNFPIMVMVHTTVAWIFGLLPARPGWYSSIMGPYYVAGAVLSGVASVVIAAGIYRHVFKWHDLISQKILLGLSRFLSWTTIIYLYFILSEHMTMGFTGTVAELRISEALLRTDFAIPFWLQIIGLLTAFSLFFLPTISPKSYRVWMSIVGSVIVVVSLWVTRFLIVVPSLTRPYLYPIGNYAPTWVEWSLVGGSFAVVILLFTLFTKIFPIIPITELERK